MAVRTASGQAGDGRTTLILYVQRNCPECDPLVDAYEDAVDIHILWLLPHETVEGEGGVADLVFQVHDRSHGGNHVGYTTKSQVPVIPLLMVNGNRIGGADLIRQLLEE